MVYLRITAAELGDEVSDRIQQVHRLLVVPFFILTDRLQERHSDALHRVPVVSTLISVRYIG